MWSSRNAFRILPDQERRARVGHRFFVPFGHFRGLVAQADDENLVGAQAQRRRQRRVLAQTPVAEESIADRDGGKKNGQRRRGHRVLGRDGHELRANERILAPAGRLSGGLLDEDHGFSRSDVRCRHRQRLEQTPAVVHRDLCPGNQPPHHALQLACLDDTAQPSMPLDLLDGAAAEQRRGRLQKFAQPERHHLFQDETFPAIDQHAPLYRGKVARRREEAGVNGTDRCAAIDVEVNLTAQIARQLLADVSHDAGFVGPARAAAR